MKKLMFMSDCSISDKVDNWMYRLHFNVLFLDRNNPNLIISATMSWPIEIMKPLIVKKKKQQQQQKTRSRSF